MRIAVIGCAHGELDLIYDRILKYESSESSKIDLVLINGDFQAVRNEADLNCMACPQKFKAMNTFYKYYSGEAKAPILTLVIGGNHEASNYFQELPYGGWLAPNIYFLGYAGVVNFGGLRIAGLSGIFKPFDFNRGHFEFPPYTNDTLRSVYHVRNLDVFRLKQLTRPVDIILSHDWPNFITNFGDVDALLRRKPFFREDIESNKLGSPPAWELLQKLKPNFWFSAHMHVRFEALVKGSTWNTKFLALDKCLPNRRFMEILDIQPVSPDPDAEKVLKLDLEWLCILKSTDHLWNFMTSTKYMPGPGGIEGEKFDYTVTDQEIRELSEDFAGVLKVPENFTQTAPCFDVSKPNYKATVKVAVQNPQTTLLCEMLDLTDPYTRFYEARQVLSSTYDGPAAENPDEIDVESSDSSSDEAEGAKNGGPPQTQKEDNHKAASPRMALHLPPPANVIIRSNITKNLPTTTRPDLKASPRGGLSLPPASSGGMSLPPPFNAESSSDTQLETAEEIRPTDPVASDGSSSTPPAVKKRRNASIYEEQEEEDVTA